MVQCKRSQVISSAAVRAAETAAFTAYKSGADSNILRNIYMSTLQSSMAISAGTVATTLGLNITIPSKDISTATYPIIGGLGC